MERGKLTVGQTKPSLCPTCSNHCFCHHHSFSSFFPHTVRESILESPCPSICLYFGPYVGFCPEDIFWTNQHFVTKVVMVLHHGQVVLRHRQVEWKDWDAVFKVKVTVRVYIIKMWQFLLYLLDSFFCNQTYFDDRSSKAKVSVNILDSCF